MLQYEHSQLLNDLTWEVVGQNIVDSVSRLPNINIAILYIKKSSFETKQYYFGFSNLDIIPTNKELLKLTILNCHILQPNDNLVILNYDKSLSSSKSIGYMACLEAKIDSSIHISLFAQVDLTASLTIHRLQKFDNWQSSEIEAVRIMANQAKLSISQMLAGEKLKELAQRETTINRITATIRSSLEPPIMFAAIAKELGSALDVDGCTLSLWTKRDRFVKCVGLYNPHEPQKIIQDSPDWQQATTSSVPIKENPILQALLYTQKPVCSADLEKQKNMARYELPWHSKARALLIVPLIVEEEIIGSITLRQNQASRDWSQADIELAEAVAAQAAIAVQQAKLYQKVKELNNYLTESVLKRFLPAVIVNKAAKGELSLDLTPEPRRVTVLFCDLVGFTNLSSQLEVVALAEILNEYLEAMTKAVFDRGGTVDKFMGDGLMAMFGAPESLSCPEQAKRALATAKTMYYYLDKLNERWRATTSSTTSIPPLQMRCGIHQGKAVVGMFGGGQRKDYTAVGKVVNIASRLQSVATPNTILLSENVARAIGNINWGNGRNFKLKGIKQDFRAFTISNNKHSSSTVNYQTNI